MKKIAVFLCVLFSFAVSGFAQSAKKTVTNADLEKFREKRSSAEREYRDTYAAKGLPSPEEIRARADARDKELVELANKLRADELERERLAIAAAQTSPRVIYSGGQPVYYSSDNTIWSYGVFNDRFGRRIRGRGLTGVNGRGYYAAGGNVWSAPLGSTLFQRPQPVFRTRSPRGRH